MEQNINIKNHGGEILFAFIMTAIAPGVLCSIIASFSMLSSALSGENIQSFLAGEIMGLGVIATIVAFLHILVLGLPLFFLGFKLRMIRWWTTLIIAFIVGVLPYSLLSGFFTYGNFDEIPPAMLNEFLYLGLFGLSGGITFWLLWRYWILEKPSTNFDANN